MVELRQLAANECIDIPEERESLRLLGEKSPRFLHLPTDVVERAFVGTEVILAAGEQIAALPRLRTVQRQFDREQSSLRVA